MTSYISTDIVEVLIIIHFITAVIYFWTRDWIENPEKYADIPVLSSLFSAACGMAVGAAGLGQFISAGVPGASISYFGFSGIFLLSGILMLLYFGISTVHLIYVKLVGRVVDLEDTNTLEAIDREFYKR